MEFHILIKNILATATVRHISISTVGTIINGLLGALFFIVLGRMLGPAEFGLLVVAITTLTLVADIADLGVNTGLINFLGRYRQADPNIVRKFLKLGLEMKIGMWLIIGPLLWLSAPWVSVVVFEKPELMGPLRIVSIGVGGLLLFSYLTNALQALEKFIVWSGINIFSNALRLGLILLFITLGIVTVENSLWVYCLVLFVATLVGGKFLPKRFWMVSGQHQLLGQFTHYTSGVAAFIVLAAVASRLDMFLTAHFLSNFDLGIYSAASQLTVAAPQLIYAIAAAIAPKLASLQTDDQAKKYLLKLQMLVGGVSLVIILGLPLSFWVIPWVYGSVYQDSVWPFIILMLGQVIFLLSIPTHQAIFYYFQQPKLFVGISLFKLIVIAGVGWWLIPLYGPIGAAWTVVLGSMIDGLIPVVWVIRRLRK